MEGSLTNYIDAERLRKKLIDRLDLFKELSSDTISPIRIDECEKIIGIIDSLQQEQSKERLIQVKCMSPYDESWEKDKVYTCNVWHHGSLNIDFWDVYYDYGNKPNYVQFSSIEMLNKEFAILQQELPDLPGIEEPGIPGKDYIPVEWVDACEMYGKWKIVKQEQPEVDLENEFADFLEKENAYIDDNNKISYYNGSSFDHTSDIYPVARHFFELGRNARKL